MTSHQSAGERRADHRRAILRLVIDGFDPRGAGEKRHLHIYPGEPMLRLTSE